MYTQTKLGIRIRPAFFSNPFFMCPAVELDLGMKFATFMQSRLDSPSLWNLLKKNILLKLVDGPFGYFLVHLYEVNYLKIAGLKHGFSSTPNLRACCSVGLIVEKYD